MYKGIRVTFKDGKVDWYDPCDEIIIDNCTNQYKIKVNAIEKLEEYTEDESKFWEPKCKSE